MDSETKCCVVEIHHCWNMELFQIIIERKSINYFTYGLDFHLVEHWSLTHFRIMVWWDLNSEPFDYLREKYDYFGHKNLFV